MAVLHPSDKSVGNPGVSLVQSPTHLPCNGGVLINFHLGNHAALGRAMERAPTLGGVSDSEIVDAGDGVRYTTILDCEGNRLALSSYEPLADEDE
jgi:predicted enzyme related to lactoylglutathione lyase